MSIKIVVHKTNGLQGSYQQSTSKHALEIVKKLVPRELFTRGVMILGTGNPFTLLNPQHVAIIAVETQLELKSLLPPGIESATQFADRASFLQKLDQRWARWRKLSAGGPGLPFEALVHLELAGGWEQYIHVVGKFPDRRTESKVMETLLSMPVLCVRRNGSGINYINPSAIIRARIYHSNTDPFRPTRLLPVDPEEI